MINNFDFNKFEKFSTSSGIEKNYVGKYDDKIVRIFQDNIALYKEVVSFCNSITGIIKSEIYFENDSHLVIEHEKLEFITYYTEWTKHQKVLAALSVLKIQKELAKKGFFLFDPHAFNITFKNAEPVYFDLGSIKKGKVKPYYWFLNNFCGGLSKDYWDSVLNINVVSKFIIAFGLLISNSPYDYLIHKITKSEKKILEKTFGFFIHLFPKSLKYLKLVPLFRSYFTNWSDYEQKEPVIQIDNPRVINFKTIINKYKPKFLLDIGANKGAYSKLALSLGVEKAVCADLDETSLNILIEDVNLNQLPIWTAKLNLIDYNEKPGCYGTYDPIHKRLNSDFCICLAVVHHICYFGNTSFEVIAERLNRFTSNILIVEFIPFNDIHLAGPVYKGQDRAWYTTDNFIKVMSGYFPKDYEIFESYPSPRILIKFEK